MPNKFQRYIKSRLFKHKEPATLISKKPPRSNSNSSSSSRSCVISGCHQRPRTLSFAVPKDPDVKDIDRLLLEHFSSLNVKDEENHANDEQHKEADIQNTSIIPGSLCFNWPGNSTQLCMEPCSGSSSSFTDTSSKLDVDVPEDCIAVTKRTTNPFDEFRQSMQEMIEMRVGEHEKIDWEFMEGMLFCYLNLNDKESYKYILNAFVDLVLVFRQSQEERK